MTYSWIIPVWNESRALSGVINEIRKTLGNQVEIIVVDDGSTDGPIAPKCQIIKIKHSGKWTALREGFKRATGKVIITCDGDGQDMPSEIVKLIDKLDQGYDVVSGARSPRNDVFFKVWLSRLGSAIMGFRDLNSPFKVYRSPVMAKLPTEGDLLRYSLWTAQKLGFKVVEVPVRHQPRQFGKSKFGVIKYVRIIYDVLLLNLLFRGSGRLE